MILAVVKDGKVLARAHSGLSHEELVRRSLGDVPEGASVVTIGKFQGEIVVKNSYSFSGNQGPASWEIVEAMRRLYK